MRVEQDIWKSSAGPRFSLRTLLIAVTVTSICLGLVAYVRHRAAVRQAELARLAKMDKATVEEIVKDVEAIRAKLGRAPKDKTELEALLGRPMPEVHDHGYPTPIHYQRTGDNSFMLQYELLATDDWIYDSDKPKAGWVQHYY